MLFCNWVATYKKKGGGYVELKNNIGTNCDVNTKLGNATGDYKRLQNMQFYISGV